MYNTYKACVSTYLCISLYTNMCIYFKIVFIMNFVFHDEYFNLSHPTDKNGHNELD